MMLANKVAASFIDCGLSEVFKLASHEESRSSGPSGSPAFTPMAGLTTQLDPEHVDPLSSLLVSTVVDVESG
jgi:hypothetical protein